MKETANVDSFYHLSETGVAEKSCCGTACFVARHLNPDLWQRASSQTERVYCLGKCYAAPASGNGRSIPFIESRCKQPIILRRLIEGGAQSLAEYSGYRALEKALTLGRDEIIRNVESSGLRGRGGAGFPTGKKWRAVFERQSEEKYVVANADEGDPGAYCDRLIMEGDPHALIEAMAIAAFAVGAQKGFIYLRVEYPDADRVLQRALAEARSAGLLGENIFQRGFSFDIDLIVGQGSYVCGEETAMLNSIEGRRPEVRSRPPYPTERGLFQKPTLVNNVETLASVPWIVLNGGEVYRALGFSKSRGTKVVSLNSLFRRPGLYEIEFGIPVRRIIEEIGGGLKTGQLKGVIIGGPLAGIIPPHLFDTRFGFDELHSIGASVGHGGVIAFDEHTSIAELMHHVFAFGAYESCGKCTPCRIGSRRVEAIYEQVLKTDGASQKERDEAAEIISALEQTSLCGLGTGLADFARSAARYYPEEFRGAS